MDYKQISRFEFDSAAATYDADISILYEKGAPNYSEMANKLSEESFSSVLDVGCGTGRMLETLSVRFPGCRLTGMDLSAEMLKQARNKNIPNTELFLGDAESLPFPDGSFDRVLCSMSFHHYPEPNVFICEAFRVLKKNGLLIIQDPTDSAARLLWYKLSGYYRKLNADGNGVVQLYTPGQLKQLLRRSGFFVEEATRVDRGRMRVTGRKR